MKNKLIDLNNHLFAQLERLSDEDLKPEELKVELARAQAISSVSKNIISNASLAFKVAKFKDEGSLMAANNLPTMLEDKRS
jgi:hypothetical protein